MRFHNLAFTRTLVVDATQMKHTVYYHPQQFAVIRSAYQFGIRSHGIERNEHLARNAILACIIKCNNIGIIIMVKKFTIYAQNFLVITKYESKLSDSVTVIAGNKGNPSIEKARPDIGHCNRPGSGPFNILAHYWIYYSQK